MLLFIFHNGIFKTMKREHIETVKKLAKETGKPYPTILRFLNGTRRPSPELAATLEKVSGVPRLSWLYPNEFINPLKIKNN
jgi:hypothetical protein